MKRILLIAGLAFFGSSVNAAEIKGTVKTADKEKNVITVTVEGKETTYTLGKDASIVSVKTVMGKKNKPMEEVTAIDNGLAGVKEGAKVTVLTDKQDDKEVVTSVKVTGDGAEETKKKKKKKTT